MRAMKSYADVEVDVKATEGGLLVTAPAKLLWTAKNYGFMTRTTSAVAAIVDEPTTAALGTLWNGEASGGKVYVIDKLFAFQDVSAAAPSRWALWACVHDVGMSAVTADITIGGGNAGQASYGGNARFDVGATVVDDGWFPVTNSRDVEATGILGGASAVADVFGSLIVPPTSAISLHVVASSTDEDFTVGVMWYEVPQSELHME